MPTNIQVITDSLRYIGVISETETPSAEQGSHALTALNDMLAAWEETEIKLGYFEQDSTSDDCPIPNYAVLGVKAKLAEALAPTYGASISIELARKIDEGFGIILRKEVSDKIEKADMSHLPTGASRWDINTDGF